MIPENFYIKDIRSYDTFKTITFSNYSKKEVIKTLDKSLINGLIEEACYWSSELICSGHISELINQLILFSSNFINIECFDISEWIINETASIVNSYDKKNPIMARNNQFIRNHISNIIVGLCECNKKKIPSITITEYDISTNSLKNKILHKSVMLVDKVVVNSDPVEMQIVANEFANHLRNPGAMIRNKSGIIEGSLYWVYWILKWDKLTYKKNKNYKCAVRNVNGVDKKFHNDIIWLVWNIIFNECKFRKNEMLTRRVNTLFNLFKRGYKPSFKNSRTCHLIHAILIITNKLQSYKMFPIDNSNYFKIIQSCGNINSIYREIKNKSEKSEKIGNTYNQNKLSVGGYKYFSVGNNENESDITFENKEIPRDLHENNNQQYK